MNGTKRSAAAAGMAEGGGERKMVVRRLDVVKNELAEQAYELERTKWELFQHPKTKAAREKNATKLLERLCGGTLSDKEKEFLSELVSNYEFKVAIREGNHTDHRDATDVELRIGPHKVNVLVGVSIDSDMELADWSFAAYTHKRRVIWGKGWGSPEELKQLFSWHDTPEMFVTVLKKIRPEVGWPPQRNLLVRLHPEANKPKSARTWWKQRE